MPIARIIKKSKNNCNVHKEDIGLFVYLNVPLKTNRIGFDVHGWGDPKCLPFYVLKEEMCDRTDKRFWREEM